MLVSQLNDIAKNNKTSIKRMRNAINRSIESATQEHVDNGTKWYDSAYDECVDIAINSPHTIQQVAGAVSHLSPRQHWLNNIKYAKMVIETGDAPCLNRSIENAKRALKSNNPIETFSPTSFKTRSFYDNMLKNYESVTVDTWAARLALSADDGEKVLGRKGMYQAISHAYRLSAKDHGLPPAQAQAIAWCVVRDSHL